MTELRKIVVDDYPVDNLPNDIRKSLEPGQRVRGTVAAYEKEPRYRRLHGIAAHRKTTPQEAVARIRALRNEWD